MKKYHREYKTEIELDDNGKEHRTIQYVGDYYVLPMKEKDKNKIFIKFLLINVLYFLLFILAGLVNNEGSRNIFIAVPYAFLFLPAVYLMLGTLSFLKTEEKMERAVYDKGIGRMYRSSMGILYISVYLCIADTIFLLRRRQQIQVEREAAFLCICIFVLACIYMHNKYLQNMKKKVMICRRENGVPAEK